MNDAKDESINALNDKFGFVPIGGIINFCGRLEELNDRRWALCDGGTIDHGPLSGQCLPDLNDLFVRGTTCQSSVGRITGEDLHQHPEFGDIGGSFSGQGTGRTNRKTGTKYGWGDDDCHPQNEGDSCFTMEWNVATTVNGRVTTNSHQHASAKSIPRHMQLMYIMRIG